MFEKIKKRILMEFRHLIYVLGNVVSAISLSNKITNADQSLDKDARWDYVKSLVFMDSFSFFVVVLFRMLQYAGVDHIEWIFDKSGDEFNKYYMRVGKSDQPSMGHKLGLMKQCLSKIYNEFIPEDKMYKMIEDVMIKCNYKLEK